MHGVAKLLDYLGVITNAQVKDGMIWWSQAEGNAVF